MLTEDQKREYIRSGGTKCPFCGSDNLTRFTERVDGERAWQDVRCEDCDRSLRSIYELTDVRETT